MKSVCLFLLATFAPCSQAAVGDLLWSDEFDDTTYSEPNPSYWSYALGTGTNGWGNGELENYTSDPSNVNVANGYLNITAIRESDGTFTSARIYTQDKVLFQYGTVVANISVPDLNAGLWAAFWTLGYNFGTIPWPDCGEIDIAELGQGLAIAEGVVNQRVVSAATWEYEGQYAHYPEYLDASGELNGTFHEYKLEWTKDLITTYVDSQEILSIDISSDACIDCEEFHQKHFLILNLAVGGGFTSGSSSSSSGATSSSGCSTSGTEGGCYRTAEEITAPLPANMLVDYVRIYDNGDTIFWGPTPSPSVTLDANPQPTSLPEPSPTSIPATIPAPGLPTSFPMPTSLPTSLPLAYPTGIPGVVPPPGGSSVMPTAWYSPGGPTSSPNSIPPIGGNPPSDGSPAEGGGKNGKGGKTGKSGKSGKNGKKGKTGKKGKNGMGGMQESLSSLESTSSATVEDAAAATVLAAAGLLAMML